MDSFAYLSKAATAWFMGFFPLFEIYLAVPAALALGLDSVSAVFWSVLGNFTPVPLILYAYTLLQRIRPLERYLSRPPSARLERLVGRYGSLAVLVMTPLFGVWFMALSARALGMPRHRLLMASLVSITLYAVVIASTIRFGLMAVAA